MLGENSILKDKNYLILIVFICGIFLFQNQYLSQLNSQNTYLAELNTKNQEIIDLNKDIILLNEDLLSKYQDLLEKQLQYIEDVHYMRITTQNLEEQSKDLMEKTEKLNELFFDQMY